MAIEYPPPPEPSSMLEKPVEPRIVSVPVPSSAAPMVNSPPGSRIRFPLPALIGELIPIVLAAVSVSVLPLDQVNEPVRSETASVPVPPPALVVEMLTLPDPSAVSNVCWSI